MQLEYKPDWEETQERYRAFWAHEYFGRCALAALLRNVERWSVDRG